jgi:hypothetical protein
MTAQAHQHQAIDSPFHSGERAIQTRAGVREEAEKRGQRMLSSELNNQQRQFFPQLPFLLSAHIDTDGQPWAGLITGKPGFIAIEDTRNECTLHWDSAHNPTQVSVQANSPLGLLGIELATRRRNRLNAHVLSADARQWRLSIDQGYGNCPKYINERPWPAELFARDYTVTEQSGLSNSALSLARTTDTFFIATNSGPEELDGRTQSSAWGADVSHRGGDAGFLQWEDGRLKFEDYPGNNMFNTLGNIARHPQCGILILDFSSGDIMQLAARAEIEHSPAGREIFLEISSTRHWSAACTPSKERP